MTLTPENVLVNREYYGHHQTNCKSQIEGNLKGCLAGLYLHYDQYHYLFAVHIHSPTTFGSSYHCYSVVVPSLWGI